MKDPIIHRITSYNLDLLPNKHLRTLEVGVENQQDWEERSGFSIGYPGWNFLYYTLLCTLRPNEFNLIIETGTNNGCSTIILAQALEDTGRPGIVRSVEIDQERKEIAALNLDTAGLSHHVELFHGDSLKMLPSMVDARVRVAFLDGNHLQDYVVNEFEAVLPWLHPDGLVIFDNTYPIADETEDQRVNGGLREIVGRHGGNLINLPIVSWYTPGLALWQKDVQLWDN